MLQTLFLFVLCLIHYTSSELDTKNGLYILQQKVSETWQSRPVCSFAVLYFYLDSTRIALHDLQIKLILIYLIQSLCVAPSVHPLSQDI